MIGIDISKLAQWTKEFCDRWIRKANEYNVQCLDDAVDKFFSLFVAYDKLCSYMDLTLEKRYKSKRVGDRVIRVFPKATGHEKVWRAISDGQGIADIQTLRMLIADNGEFFLIVKKATLGLIPNKKENARLHKAMDSAEVEERVEAILEYLYLVRNNIFHGDKGLHPDQLKIIQPSIRCLERVVHLGMNVVSQHPIRANRFRSD